MTNKKPGDAMQFLIGAVATIIVWALGVFSAGKIPFFVDYVYVSGGNETLSLLFPFFLLVYSAAFAAFCKRKSGDAMLFGAYLFLIVPSVSFVIIQVNSLLNYEFQDYIFLIIMLFFTLATSAVSAFNGFFNAVYGNIRPVGFTVVHLVFCIIMIVVAVLPPIVYMLVKSKQRSV